MKVLVITRPIIAFTTTAVISYAVVKCVCAIVGKNVEVKVTDTKKEETETSKED